MLTIACCLVVRLGLGLGLDLVFGWLKVMHTHFLIFRFRYLSATIYDWSKSRRVYVYNKAANIHKFAASFVYFSTIQKVLLYRLCVLLLEFWMNMALVIIIVHNSS